MVTNTRTTQGNFTLTVENYITEIHLWNHFIQPDETFKMPDNPPMDRLDATAATIYIKAGKKEKISKADIVGFIVNNSHLPASQVGQIVVKDHYSLVAIPSDEAIMVLPSLRQNKIKGKKVPMSITGIKYGNK